MLAELTITVAVTGPTTLALVQDAENVACGEMVDPVMERCNVWLELRLGFFVRFANHNIDYFELACEALEAGVIVEDDVAPGNVDGEEQLEE